MLNEIATTPKRHYWKWTLTIIHNMFYITISNCRLKKRTKRDLGVNRKAREKAKRLKKATLEANNFRCPVCGRICRLEDMEIHHILPVGRFPELKDDKRNMTVLCWRCHKDIHGNPFRNGELIKAKAEELNIDLKEIYHL